MGMLGSVVAGAVGNAAGTQLKSIADQELEALKTRRFETESRIKNRYATGLLDKQQENALALKQFDVDNRVGKQAPTGLKDEAYNSAVKLYSEQVNTMDETELKTMFADARVKAPDLTLSQFKTGLVSDLVDTHVERFNKQAGRVGTTPKGKATEEVDYTKLFNSFKTESIAQLESSSTPEKDLKDALLANKGNPEALRLLQEVGAELGITIEEDLGSQKGTGLRTPVDTPEDISRVVSGEALLDSIPNPLSMLEDFWTKNKREAGISK